MLDPQDLDLPAEAHKAEARWALALRAVAHPALVTAELVPAVRQGVLTMLVDSSRPYASFLDLSVGLR